MSDSLLGPFVHYFIFFILFLVVVTDIFFIKRTNFRVYLISRVEINCISRVLIFANGRLEEISRVLIFAQREKRSIILMLKKKEKAQNTVLLTRYHDANTIDLAIYLISEATMGCSRK